MLCDCTYPQPRERPTLEVGMLTDRFRPHRTTAGYVTLGTALADVIVFPGVPDKIELFTRDAGVIVQFTDRADVEIDTIELPPGMFYEPGLVAEKIRAMNAVAGVIGKLQVVGKYLHNTAGEEARLAPARGLEAPPSAAPIARGLEAPPPARRLLAPPPSQPTTIAPDAPTWATRLLAPPPAPPPPRAPVIPPWERGLEAPPRGGGPARGLEAPPAPIPIGRRKSPWAHDRPYLGLERRGGR